jgi:hypothetical protein
VTILLLKLTVSPLVILLASLLARRFGPAVGGWLIGLPVTAGPVALFLALQHGTGFSARAATGFVAGVSAQAAFVAGYAFFARRGSSRERALIAGTACFGATGAVLEAAHFRLPLLFVFALASLILGLKLLPARSVGVLPRPTRTNLVLRMVAATGMVLLITAVASHLGAGPSGVATTFPLLSTILALSVHRADSLAAVAVYRGLLLGLFALTGFATTLALLLSRVPLAAAFAVALCLTISIQARSLQSLRKVSTFRL